MSLWPDASVPFFRDILNEDDLAKDDPFEGAAGITPADLNDSVDCRPVLRGLSPLNDS